FLAGSMIQDLEYHPNGRLLAVAGEDTTVRVLETSHGLTLHTYRGHDGSAAFLGHTPDGRVLATVGLDRTVKLWDATALAPGRWARFQVVRLAPGRAPGEVTALHGVAGLG